MNVQSGESLLFRLVA